MRTKAAESRVYHIMETAFSQVGNPYRYGGNSPETGFDCSGFVSWVYKQLGIVLPRSSREMMTAGTPIARSELRPGDLVFFNYGYSHVGIYTGNGRYIHSPSTGKRIQESDLNGRGRTEHYVGARRIIDNKGVSAISENLKAEWIQASRHSTAMAMSDSAARRHTGADAYRGRAADSGGRAVTARKGRRARTQTASRSGSVKKHTVASGDTLVALAKRYGVTAADLASYNGISDRNRIKPGQDIKIPSRPAKKASSAKAKSASRGKKKASSAQAKASSRGKKASATPRASSATAHKKGDDAKKRRTT
jgi:LysM repeat protein